MSLIIFLVVGTGCGSTHSVVSIRAVIESKHCGIERESLLVIASTDDIPAVLATEFNPTQLNAPGTELVSSDSVGRQAIVNAVAKHRIQTEQLILASMGQKPNPGYYWQLENTSADLKNGELSLPLVMKRPDPNKMYAQVIVTPCILLAVTTERDISSIRLQ
ncbi:hypothetical protein NBRC116494_13730 [Aurantivibrio plasticivorans]